MSIWTDGTGVTTVTKIENDEFIIVSITRKGEPVEVNKYGERVGDRKPAPPKQSSTWLDEEDENL